MGRDQHETSAKTGRGRRRTLPPMTNSERARYYRRKHAEQSDALEVTTQELRREVGFLEIRLRVHRELARSGAPLGTRRKILQFVREFVEDGLQGQAHGLTRQRHEIVSVDFAGDVEAPVLKFRSVVRGKLSTPVIHSIYPFVLGNTIVLDELMHQEIEYGCTYLFYFRSDGSLERQHVEIDSIESLRKPLRDLATVARVVNQVDVHPDE